MNSVNSSDFKLIDVNASDNSASWTNNNSHNQKQMVAEREIRSSPEEEFFSLSCLALKVKLIEQ